MKLLTNVYINTIFDIDIINILLERSYCKNGIFVLTRKKTKLYINEYRYKCK